jgi:hypothetical protein
MTFQVSDGDVQLVRTERLNMICPPAIGERPEAGKHGGFWVELRDAEGRPLFHRVLHLPLADSVEVFSPDGTIKREFGPSGSSRVFEVLLPDHEDASSVALMGEYLDHAELRTLQAERDVEPRGARELARFEIPKS